MHKQTYLDPIPVSTGFSDPIFKTQVYVHFNLTVEELAAWEKKQRIFPVHTEKDLDFFSGIAYYFVNEEGVFTTVVWIRKFDWSVKSYGHLSHELVHVAVRMFNSDSVPVNLDTQEFFALLHQSLFETAISEYRRAENNTQNQRNKARSRPVHRSRNRGGSLRAKRARARSAK